MMFAFVLIAGSLAAGAAVLMLLPLMRRREDSRPAAAITAGVTLFALLLGGGALYAAFSNYTWVEAPAVADTPAAAAASLAKELARNPDRIEGWLDLGRRYADLQQFPLAIRAFQRADRLANGQNTEAISGVAEAMLAQDFENIRGAAGRMFERVLEMEPQNPKALLYSALAAMGRGETGAARDRFQRMLALNPREDIRVIIERQLSALDAAEAGQGGATPAPVAGGARRSRRRRHRHRCRYTSRCRRSCATSSPTSRPCLSRRAILTSRDRRLPPSVCRCDFRWTSADGGRCHDAAAPDQRRPDPRHRGAHLHRRPAAKHQRRPLRTSWLSCGQGRKTEHRHRQARSVTSSSSRTSRAKGMQAKHSLEFARAPAIWSMYPKIMVSRKPSLVPDGGAVPRIEVAAQQSHHRSQTPGLVFAKSAAPRLARPCPSPIHMCSRCRCTWPCWVPKHFR